MNRLQRLQLDVDLRLIDVWREFRRAPRQRWTVSLLAAFLRAAYIRGYEDARVDGGRLYSCYDGVSMPKMRGENP